MMVEGRKLVYLTTSMIVAYVLYKPKVIITIPALNEFKHYKQEKNAYVLLNKHQMSDFVRGDILEKIFAPRVVYSVNNCKDGVRNGAVEHENELNKDVNHHNLIPIMQEKN